MKLPNGYGSVIKHKGNRRRPYQARVTVGFTDTGIQKYQTLGWYEKREDGLAALSEYHNEPYNIQDKKITFSKLYEIWSKERQKLKKPIYTSQYKHLTALYDKQFSTLKPSNLQSAIDNTNTNFPTREKMKILLGLLYGYAMKNDIVDKRYSTYIDLGENEKKSKRKPFTNEEIQKLFDNVDKLENVDTILIMIYSCIRVGELLTIENKNIHLEDRYMIGGIKTEAGKNRIIPINRKIEPFIRNHYNLDNKYLISDENGKRITYNTYKKHIFDELMPKLEMSHYPHDCRHTGASLLDSAGANKVCEKLILGHSLGGDVTDSTYIHKSIEELIATIDLI